jgi:T5orf172 domain
MSNLYVIEDKKNQRVKVGKSNTPTDRLRNLNPGNPNYLELFHAKYVADMGKHTELLAHWMLRQWAVPEKREWFAISPHIAAGVVNIMHHLAKVVSHSDDCSLYKLEGLAASAWHNAIKELRDACEADYSEIDNEFLYEEMEQLDWASLDDILAMYLMNKVTDRYPLADLIKGTAFGSAVATAIESLEITKSISKLPYCDRLGKQSILSIDEYIQKYDKDWSGKFPMIIAESLSARSLQSPEIYKLAEIWNKYVLAYNRIYTDNNAAWPNAQSDQMIDDINVSWNDYGFNGHSNFIKFWNSDFEAVLRLSDQNSPLASTKSSNLLRELPHSGVSGVIFRPFHQGLWEGPVSDIEKTMTAPDRFRAFVAFIDKSHHLYPAPRPHPSTVKHIGYSATIHQ